MEANEIVLTLIPGMSLPPALACITQDSDPLQSTYPTPVLLGVPRGCFTIMPNMFTPTGLGYYLAPINSSPILLLLFLRPQAGQAHSSFVHHKKPGAVNANHSAILEFALLPHLCPSPSSAGGGPCCSQIPVVQAGSTDVQMLPLFCWALFLGSTTNAL